MRVLIACEYSGTVRDAFTALGHEAWSCDLLPTEKPGKHFQCDVLSVLDQGWDLMIAHPPCTYLCGMGVWWNHKRPERWQMTDAAADFFMRIWNSPIGKVAVENPIGVMNTRFRKPDQIIQPWQHGHEANKPTCLWLRGLPKITPTQVVSKGKFYTKANGSRMSAWSHITSGTRKELRASIASRTFPGIAQAMAQQWTVPDL